VDASITGAKAVFSERLAGVRVEAARNAQYALATKLATDRGFANANSQLASVVSATRTVAAKNFSPTIQNNLYATLTANVSVDSVQRALTNSYISSGKVSNIPIFNGP
jgi:hypothetical protein